MGKIDYKKIYDYNREEWKAATKEGNNKFETLIAGHYSENNHFIYELIQNAADVRATTMLFDYYEDRLEVYHDGTPFEYENVLGICSLVEGTKEEKDAGTIGKFGLGFKSVFKYTAKPHVYCNEEAFFIERYLLPKEIDLKSDDWDYERRKQDINVNENNGKVYPFINSVSLTRFILPFKPKEALEKDGLSIGDIIEKIENLDCEILLFLKTLDILYWIDNTSENSDGYYKAEIKEITKEFENEISCIKYNSKQETVVKKYLLFSKTSHVNQMENAEVKIAYELNEKQNTVKPCEESKIWVYFPTMDPSELKFIIHGSYQTPVSREKVMNPSKFNDRLFDETIKLILESLDSLKNKGFLTQKFIKEILLPSTKSSILPSFRAELNKYFRANQCFPNGHGKFYSALQLRVPVPTSLVGIINDESLSKIIGSSCSFLAFTDAYNSSDYYKWATEENEIKNFTIYDYASAIKKFPVSELGINDIKDIYKFLDENKIIESKYMCGKYNDMLENFKKEAWQILKTNEIILNENGDLVSAYNIEGKPNVYIYTKNNDYEIPPSSLVNQEISEKYSSLLKTFDIRPYDNFQYVKEHVIDKYINLIEKENRKCIKFTTDNADKEHVNDIKQILSVINKEEMQQLVKKAYLLKGNCNGKISYHHPNKLYFALAKDKISIKDYFDGIENKNYVEYKFYLDNNISYEYLKKLGVIDDLKTDNASWTNGIVRNSKWDAVGSFLWFLDFDESENAIRFITNNCKKQIEKAKNKSKEMFKLSSLYYKNMNGIIEVTAKKNKGIYDSNILKKLKGYKWLFGKDGVLYKPGEISRYDLDTELYSNIDDKNFYSILGFKQGVEDAKREKLKKEIDCYENVDKISKVFEIIQSPEYSILEELKRNPILMKKLIENPSIINNIFYVTSIINTIDNTTILVEKKFDAKDKIDEFMKGLKESFNNVKSSSRINTNNDIYKLNEITDKEEEKNIVNSIAKTITEIPEQMSVSDVEKEDLFTKKGTREFLKKNYGGLCQICGRKIPFYQDDDGTFYAYRHIKIESKNPFVNFPSNVFSLCPNCHNELSHASEQDLSGIYKKAKDYFENFINLENESLSGSIISAYNIPLEEIMELKINKNFHGKFIVIDITINNENKHIVFSDEHFIYVATIIGLYERSIVKNNGIF